ncbi:MAG TPA: ABC transporter permease subunit [Candidatus Saccharimonadales bacterium]|nr:ABC transporter permease subunit [Candidatus Saccharimonadales bacterium]
MKNVGVVWKKEVTDALRDQRTVFFMVVFPLILYPALMVGVSLMARGQEQEVNRTQLTVAVQNANAIRELADSLAALPHARMVATADPVADVRARRADVAVQLPAGAEQALAGGRQVSVTVYSDDTREISRHARGLAEQTVARFGQQATARALAQHGLPADLSRMVLVEKRDVAPPAKKAGYLLAVFLPYFLAISVVSGAVTTAIDTTAGEKDRSTLETVLVSSAGRTDLVVGKLLAVLGTAIASTVASAVGIGLTFVFGGLLFSTAERSGTALTLSVPAVLGVLAVALPMAVLVSAVLVALGCFAKSAREGQMTSVWFQMLVIFGGISSMMQQTEPQLKSFAVPVLGTALAQREILLGEAKSAHIGMAVISSVVLAAVATVIAVRLFGNEKVMFRAK